MTSDKELIRRSREAAERVRKGHDSPERLADAQKRSAEVDRIFREARKK